MSKSQKDNEFYSSFQRDLMRRGINRKYFFNEDNKTVYRADAIVNVEGENYVAGPSYNMRGVQIGLEFRSLDSAIMKDNHPPQSFLEKIGVAKKKFKERDYTWFVMPDDEEPVELKIDSRKEVKEVGFITKGWISSPVQKQSFPRHD